MTWSVQVKGDVEDIGAAFDLEIARIRDGGYPVDELTQIEAAKDFVSSVAATSPEYGLSGSVSGWFATGCAPGAAPEFGVNVSLGRGLSKLAAEPEAKPESGEESPPMQNE